MDRKKQPDKKEGFQRASSNLNPSGRKNIRPDVNLRPKTNHIPPQYKKTNIPPINNSIQKGNSNEANNRHTPRPSKEYPDNSEFIPRGKRPPPDSRRQAANPKSSKNRASYQHAPNRQAPRPQTTKQRRSSRPLNDNELRMQRIQTQRYKVKKPNKSIFVLFLKRAFICFLTSVFLFIICTGLFLLDLKSVESDSPKTISYLLSSTDGEGEKLSNASIGRFLKNGVFYLNMTEIASLYLFTTTGDRTELRYITDTSNNENVRVFINSSYAIVNGSQVSLSSPCIRESGNVYLPLKFFTSYVTGMNIEFSEKENILKITRIVEKISGDKIVYKSIGFSLKGDKITSPISENDIP